MLRPHDSDAKNISVPVFIPQSPSLRRFQVEVQLVPEARSLCFKKSKPHLLQMKQCAYECRPELQQI